jgi:hypothetical protein
VVVLFRTLRPRSKSLASSLGLIVGDAVAFYASISVLKEPLYFLAAAAGLLPRLTGRYNTGS